MTTNYHLVISLPTYKQRQRPIQPRTTPNEWYDGTRPTTDNDASTYWDDDTRTMLCLPSQLDLQDIVAYEEGTVWIPSRRRHDRQQHQRQGLFSSNFTLIVMYEVV
jgi:hypothetical protein